MLRKEKYARIYQDGKNKTKKADKFDNTTGRNKSKDIGERRNGTWTNNTDKTGFSK